MCWCHPRQLCKLSFCFCVDTDECAGDPCLHGATCVDAVNSYACDCAPRFTGENCELGTGLITLHTLRLDIVWWIKIANHLCVKSNALSMPWCCSFIIIKYDILLIAWVYCYHWRIQWGGGCGGCNPPPLNFQKKIVFTRVAVVIDLSAWPLW